MNAKLSEMLRVSMIELDAEGPADVAWVTVEDWSSFMAVVMRSVGTGGLDAFTILGNTVAAGSGTDVVLADLSTAPESITLADINAVNDYAMLEVSQADLDAAKSGETPLLGISASVGHVTATDESVITYISGSARYNFALQTPQTVIA